MEIITVDQLITEVREQANEMNTSTKTDDAILRVLNRGQRIINRTLARHYVNPILTSATFDLSSGASQTIPEDAFADMVTYIEISVPGYPSETRFRSYQDNSRVATAGVVDIPLDWTVKGRSVEFLQTPSGAYDAEAWYVKKLDKLVKQQGQLTATPASTYVLVDTVGSSLSADANSLSSYVNVVNCRTGEIRGTFQIASMTAGRINLRASPMRSTVLGRAVSGSAALATCGAAADDYICTSDGVCVPYFPDELSTFLVEFGVAEVTRSLAPEGNAAQLEQRIVAEYKAEIEAEWAGRQSGSRIKNRSAQWPTTTRRFPVSN